MADIDDFELINETNLSNEQTFELIDINNEIGNNTKIDTPTTTTPDVVLPLLIPTPLVMETSPVIQEQKFNPIINTSEPVESNSLIETTTNTIPFVPIKRTVVSQPPPSTPIVFAPVPSLPKAPPLQRYGNAALIPHNLDTSFDVDTIIDKSKKNQQITLNISTQHQQQRDIQTVLEQRRKLFNKN